MSYIVKKLMIIRKNENLISLFITIFDANIIIQS